MLTKRIRIIALIACVILAGAFVFIACNNEPEDDTPSDVDSGSVTGTTVYVAGFYGYEDEDFMGAYACYWVNGVRHNLSVPSEAWWGVGEDIVVFGNNVYILGGYYDSTGFIRCYWVNGMRQNLTLPAGAQFNHHHDNYRIVVSGSSVYVSGVYINGNIQTAGYWVNGELQTLSVPAGVVESGIYGVESGIYGMVVAGTNVYIIGYYDVFYDGYNNYVSVSCYWINGELQTLSVPAGATSIYNDIAVSGNNVYISGGYIDSSGSVSCYWINGELQTLSLPAGVYISSAATKIAVSGNNLHIVGYYYVDGTGSTLYWVNGVRQVLPAGLSSYDSIIVDSYNNLYIFGSGYSDDTGYAPYYWVNGVRHDLSIPAGVTWGSTEDIVVSGTNVYVAGIYEDSNENLVPCYWVNGVRHDLSIPAGAQGMATGIAVVTK